MFPAATVALLVRNVVHRRLLAIFCSIFKFCWVLDKFSHGLSRYTWSGLVWKGTAASRRLKGASAVWIMIYHGRQYVSSRRVTFWWDPSRISRCDQGYETFFTFWSRLSTDETYLPTCIGARCQWLYIWNCDVSCTLFFHMCKLLLIRYWFID